MYNEIILLDKNKGPLGRNCLYDTIVYHETMGHTLAAWNSFYLYR